MILRLQTLSTFVLLAALSAPAHAALGPSLASKAASGEQLSVIILLDTDPSGPYLAARSGEPAAYAMIRSDIEIRNTRAVSDFLARSSAAAIDLHSIHSYWLAPFVAATVSADDLSRLAALPGVDAVIEDAPVDLIAPISAGATTADIDATVVSQDAIGARTVWHEGLTGKGVLVASIDTGVDGDHPALAGRYRGLSEPASTAWMDPFGGDFPDDPVGHGTHTMGTVLGRDGIDTIGVAPDAQWIAAGVVDRGLAFAETLQDLLDAFQWLADPDGNPETHSDVPDVVLNSWGIPQGILPECDNTFWAVVDNLEALGAVVIFAAGNEGPALGTLRLPADRGDTPLSCFSVGAIDASDPNFTVAVFSSRGPVSCNPDLIKPELVAPGLNIRSSWPGGGYKIMSGTSMAAPYVAGAVALMRQYNPDVTPLQIKQALIESAHDLGTIGPDYITGYGLLDIQGAIDRLPKPKPLAWQWNVPTASEPGSGEMELSFSPVHVVMKNVGRSIERIRVEASTIDPDDNLTDQTLFTSDQVAAEVGSVDMPLSLTTSADHSAGDRIWVNLHITAQSPVLDTNVRIGVQVGEPPLTSAMAQHTGQLTTTASNFGRFDAGDAVTLSVSNPVFAYSDQVIPFRGGLRIVANGIDHSGFAGTDPFEPTAAGILTNGTGAVLSRASFHDTRTANATAVRLDQTVLAPESGPGDYIIYSYSWEKEEPTFVTDDLRLGAWFAWDLPGTEQYVSSRVPGAMLVHNGDTYVGTVWLGSAVERRVEAFDVATTSLPSVGIGENLTGATGDAFVLALTEGPTARTSGDFALALVAADNLADWESAAERARDQYARVSGHQSPTLPEQFTLLQNYPNPFNPATTIRYELAQNTQVRVDIFNILGRRVSTVVDDFQPAGAYSVVWDATDDHGMPLPSGVYFLRFTAGQEVHTGKMTLLR